ncbi:MAG: formylglycine-generating enzyme family protein [Cytophagaceae bacterium]|nr:formylglycine-generating enzyme family protein [Cytophagaceae bacterium]
MMKLTKVFQLLKRASLPALSLLVGGTSLLFAQEPAYTNRIGMEFVLIKPGRMVVGKFEPTYPKPSAASTRSEPSSWAADDFQRAEQLAKRDATPGFPVEIKRPFYIGKFEVTQAQWKAVMRTNPAVFQGDKVTDDADKHPVDNVTWADARAFIRKLNQLEKGNVYRLPTEFEWEYAARAGATDDIAWAEIRQAAKLGTTTTQAVGQSKPNAWSLYDTLGNVWEWVQDVYNEKLFADPVPPRSGKQHVLKGASFVGDVKNATYLTHAAGPGNGWDVGFRVVLEVK